MNDAMLLTDEEIKALPPDGGPHFNRLVFEKSPYLLQHAANPVNWFPWGREAFEKAEREEKPIFLSIGYSTCHWCHVMEKESFEDREVASLMNEFFISVKVDREERPDLDHIYMTVTQALTGSGGWPMTVVMTPEAKPFFAGTYFPKKSRTGRPGMLELIPNIASVWEEKRSDVLRSAEEITGWLKSDVTTESDVELGEETLHKAYRELARRFDPAAGGFGQEPKFPTPHNLIFLLRYWKRFNEPHALDMVEITLQQMRRGGIWDHVGFGFHRYSTDRVWLVPHFEKMLYDQALLADAYLEAFLATGLEDYKTGASQVFEYVLREMTGPEGGFYSAEDADSEGEEGKFYVWATGEVESILGEDAELLLEAYSFEENGNFRDEATGIPTGRNIPHMRRSLEMLADEMNLPLEDVQEMLDKSRRRLLEVRKERIHPYKDDKILTDWNGLMIAAMARGGRIVGDPRLTIAAEKAADFVWTSLRDDNGVLLKRYRDGIAGLPGHLDDHAFFLLGLIELYETNFQTQHLERAIQVADRMIELFHDPEDGGFFFTAAGMEELLVRKKEVYDGATPSGNSVAALALQRLGRITANQEWEMIAAGVLDTFGGQVEGSPAGFTCLMCALDFLTGPSCEIVIAGSPDSEGTIRMIDAVREIYLPNSVVIFRPEPEDKPEITGLAPYTLHQRAVDEKAAAYICRNYTCSRPTTEVEELMLLLSNLSR